MLQQDNPEDYVMATGETHTVREFAELAFKHAGIDLEWKGEAVDEKGIDKKTGRVLVEVDPKYFRPSEVELLVGDSSKAKKDLGWEPRVTFSKLIKIMVELDLKAIEEKGDI